MSFLQTILQSKLTHQLSTIAMRRIVEKITEADKHGIVKEAEEMGVNLGDVVNDLAGVGVELIIDIIDGKNEPIKKTTPKKKPTKPRAKKVKVVQPV